MLRNVLGVTALALAASVASAQQPTHKSATIPAAHPVPVAATQHARVPATVMARKATKTAAREERAEERTEARKDSLAPRKTVHHASKSMKKHRSAKHVKASHDSTARKS